MLQSVSVWSSGNIVGHINKIAARYVGLVLVSCSSTIVTWANLLWNQVFPDCG